MKSLKIIEKQAGVKALSYHNTVFSQLLKLVPGHEFETLVNQHHKGRKLSKMTRWSQFVSMALAQLSGRCSLRVVVSQQSAQRSKYYHLGIARVSHSSLAQINEKQPYTLYEGRYSQSSSPPVRNWRHGMVFVSRTSFIPWMPP